MPAIRAASLVLLLLLPAVLVAQESTPPALFGRIEGDSYVSPTGVFRVLMPVLPELGGEIRDTEYIVTFDDPVSTHISIACFPMDNVQKWEYETRTVQEYLEYFYANFVLTDFHRRFPGTQTEAAQFIPALLNGALAIYNLLPGGSFFENRNRIVDSPATAAAKRGSLLFVRDRHVLVLSLELAEHVTQARAFQKTAAQENDILRGRLIELAGRVQFPAAGLSKKTLTPR